MKKKKTWVEKGANNCLRLGQKGFKNQIIFSVYKDNYYTSLNNTILLI